MKQKIRNIIFYSLIFLLTCCKNEVSNSGDKSYQLKPIHNSKTIEGVPKIEIYDSASYIKIVIDYTKNGKPQKSIKTFVRIKGSYYEQKLISNYENRIVDTVNVLSFAKKDTTVTYVYGDADHPAYLPEGFDDWRYTISMMNKDSFKLIKNHLRDSSFVEEFYFDDSFAIKKVNLYYSTDTLMFQE